MMARVYEQQVPPSLLDVYQDTIRNGRPTSGNHGLAGANPSATAAQKQRDASKLSKFASSAASWLLDRWMKNADAGSRSTFFRARRAEIIAGNFDAEFWAAGVMFSDTTELCVPAVYPYTGAWNPAYWDELRKPTRCSYQDVGSAYPTPAGEGTEEAPAPGWKGTVIDEAWRDLYHAQRRLTFALQHGLKAGDGRPVAIVPDWTTTADATTRGNRNWFCLIVHPIFHPASLLIGSVKGACVRWAHEDQYRLSIPGDSTEGWTHTVTHRDARDGRRFAEFHTEQACDRLTLRLASPPSLGFYGSRNDNVTVRNTGIAAVYTAK